MISIRCILGLHWHSLQMTLIIIYIFSSYKLHITTCNTLVFDTLYLQCTYWWHVYMYATHKHIRRSRWSSLEPWRHIHYDVFGGCIKSTAVYDVWINNAVRAFVMHSSLSTTLQKHKEDHKPPWWRPKVLLLSSVSVVIQLILGLNKKVASDGM